MAFAFCYGLDSIIIPNSVNTLGEAVFSKCNYSEKIYLRASSVPSTWDSNWKNNCNAEVVLGYTGD